MHSTIKHGPAFAMATVDLDPGEAVTVEAGSLVAMSDGLHIKTHIGGNAGGFFTAIFSFFAALFRKFFGGETLFVNTYTPTRTRAGRVMMAPALSGDIINHELDGTRAIVIQRSSYLASAGNVRVKTVFGGLKSLFSGEGAFWLRCSGTGDLWINCYGAIHTLDVDGTYVVDTGHVVGFEDTLDYKIRGAGNLRSTLLSGEGLTLHFSGQGKLLIQSRNLNGLVRWITPRFRG